VEESLLQKGIDAFTPKVALRKHWSDRVKIVREPLFKGYCFAKFELCEKLQAVRQPGVVSVVHFKEQYVPVPESVIQSLKILTEQGIKLDPCPYIKVNNAVVITKGPLKGVEGLVLEKRNKNTTLVISVEAIGSAVKCVVDIDSVDVA
jgi:transcription antitermination factor NusG